MDVYVTVSHIDGERRYHNIMRNIRFPAEALSKVLEDQKAATMPELQSVLGTRVSMTVFRKLKSLGYRTSYSHGGRYYTLDRIAQFDERGLWSCRSAWFSHHGTLLATLEHFVRKAQAGYFARELKAALHVGVRESLLKLVRRGRIARKPMSEGSLYCSPEPAVANRQVISRRAQQIEQTPEEARITDEVKAALMLFLSLLDEQQRRIYAGLEALKAGRGGDPWIAEMLNLHPATVARGRRELLAGKVVVEGIRKKGGGRKPLEKKRRV